MKRAKNFSPGDPFADPFTVDPDFRSQFQTGLEAKMRMEKERGEGEKKEKRKEIPATNSTVFDPATCHSNVHPV